MDHILEQSECDKQDELIKELNNQIEELNAYVKKLNEDYSAIIKDLNERLNETNKENYELKTSNEKLVEENSLNSKKILELVEYLSLKDQVIYNYQIENKQYVEDKRKAKLTYYSMVTPIKEGLSHGEWFETW